MGHHDGVSNGPGQVDVLEGGTGPGWWERVPPAARRLGVAVVVLLVAVAALVWARDRAADRERARRVDLATTLGVVSSSTSPPGGQVSFFALVRNDGELPVSITSIDGTGDVLRVRMKDDADRPLPAGAEIEIPLSVRVTCAAGDGRSAPLRAEVGVRRADGGATSRVVDLEPAVLVLDVAGTLCAVRPDLRDHELSGPVLRGPTAADDGS